MLKGPQIMLKDEASSNTSSSQEKSSQILGLSAEQINRLHEEFKEKEKKTKLGFLAKCLTVSRILHCHDQDSPMFFLLPEVFRNNPFNRKFILFYESNVTKESSILEIKQLPQGPICVEISKYLVADALLAYFEEVCTDKESSVYKMTRKMMLAAVEQWMGTVQKIIERPFPICFKSQDIYAYWRLPFDPILNSSLDNLTENAPTWSELISRMSDYEAFMYRVASIFDPKADRKQVVYISGPKDSGKSQVMNLLAYLAGVHSDGGGSYATLSNEDLESQFWRASLLNKRVVCIGEASPRFLCTEQFKAITGDSWHNINQKGKPMFLGKLHCLLFFFSNDAASIDSKPDLIERVMDIRIEPVNLSSDELIGEVEYQNRLKKELPYFIGCCIAAYNERKLSGRRIPCKKESLLQAIDEKESDAVTLFDDKYIVDETSYVEQNSVTRYLQESGVDRKTQYFVPKIWMRRFNIKLKQKRFKREEGNDYRIVWCFIGMREATEGELRYQEN